MKKFFFFVIIMILTVTAASPETVDEYLEIGERYFAESRFHEAHTAVMEALRLNPNYALANFHLGVIYYRLNEISLALEYLSRAIELNNKLAEAYIWQGRIYNESLNDHARAFENYNMAIYLEPENDRYHRARAFLFSDTGDFVQALAGFNRAIEINPLNYENFQQRGVFYVLQGLYVQALDDLNEAINLNNEIVKNFTFRGTSFFRLGRYEEAMEDFNVAVRLDSNDVLGYQQRGLANILLGRYHEAILDFIEVVRIDPNNSDAYFNRSVAYRHLASLSENYFQAWEYLEKAQEDEAIAERLDGQRE